MTEYVYAPIWLITALGLVVFAWGAFLGRISK